MENDVIYPARVETVERLLRGSIDMHIHPGPHQEPRRPDGLTVAIEAQQAGIRAFVIKSRAYSSAPMGSIISHAVPNILVFGGLVLDYESGGLNPFAVEVAIHYGAKIIWMPVFCSAHHMREQGEKGQGITILDDKGKILPIVKDILKIIREKDVILATGHLSKAEIFTLVAEARQAKVSKVLVTHATEPKIGFTVEEQQKLVRDGALIEHSLFACLPYFTLTKIGKGSKVLEPREIARGIKAVGAEHCILSTDSGNSWGPTPPAAMRMFIAMMLACGLSEKEVELMVKTTPAGLLGIDKDVT